MVKQNAVDTDSASKIYIIACPPHNEKVCSGKLRVKKIPPAGNGVKLRYDVIPSQSSDWRGNPQNRRRLPHQCAHWFAMTR